MHSSLARMIDHDIYVTHLTESNSIIRGGNNV